jgi:hypothetical protein
VPNSKRGRAAANIPVSAVTCFDGTGNYYVHCDIYSNRF